MDSNRVVAFAQILQVHAEDGDKGSPREVRYGLVSEGNPFTSFFDINETSGKFSPRTDNRSVGGNWSAIAASLKPK